MTYLYATDTNDEWMSDRYYSVRTYDFYKNIRNQILRSYITVKLSSGNFISHFLIIQKCIYIIEIYYDIRLRLILVFLPGGKT